MRKIFSTKIDEETIQKLDEIAKKTWIQKSKLLDIAIDHLYKEFKKEGFIRP